ncbi:uncharacterized protein LOC141537031 [Cotesia typhae]|uniref:uncharacterized protein LOC141537031 n=1 Tax=Cotesia typhae TaxID=2053667 RepID=UPI003D689A35
MASNFLVKTFFRERRRINPAIYAEPLTSFQSENLDLDLQNSGELRKCDLIDGLAGLSVEDPVCYSNCNSYSNYNYNSYNCNKHELLNTYRCNSLSSLTSSRPSVNSSKTRSTRTERRGKIINDFNAEQEDEEVQRYSVNGYKVVQISTSLPNCTSKRPRSSEKKLAYDQWIERKRSELLERKKKIAEIEEEKKIQEEKFLKEKEERERKDKESFEAWVEKKKQDDLKKKLIKEKELEMEARLKEIEDKTVIAKEICLKRWCRKKDKEIEAQKSEEKLKIQEAEADKKIRLAKSVEAFEKWRMKSKKCPKPATQGLLPDQQATPAYVNPVPWLDTTEEILD